MKSALSLACNGAGERRHNPIGVVLTIANVTQGSRVAATLGFRPKAFGVGLGPEHRWCWVGGKTLLDQTAIQCQIATTGRQIDQLVYELYGLSNDEVRIVEEATTI